LVLGVLDVLFELLVVGIGFVVIKVFEFGVSCFELFVGVRVVDFFCIYCVVDKCECMVLFDFEEVGAGCEFLNVGIVFYVDVC